MSVVRILILFGTETDENFNPYKHGVSDSVNFESSCKCTSFVANS